ncbi:MAG TPA: SURF1 family protein [Nocardioides sp.]
MPPSRLHPVLRPRVWPIHLLGLVAVAVAVSLGMWQYGAWQAHRELAAAEVTTQDPVPLSDLLPPGEGFPGADVGAPAEITGTWRDDLTFSVDDRRVDGVAGSWVVTPVETADGGGALLPVVRGWTSEPDAVGPAIGTVSGAGWLQPGEGTGAVDDEPDDRVLPQLRLADVVRLLDADIYQGYLVLDIDGETGVPVSNAAAEGLSAVTPEQVPEVAPNTSLRNLLYAIEWWVFAAFAAFVWWRFARDEVDRARVAEELPADVGEVPSPEERAQEAAVASSS